MRTLARNREDPCEVAVVRVRARVRVRLLAVSTVSHILHTISGNFMFRLARTCNDC